MNKTFQINVEQVKIVKKKQQQKTCSLDSKY